MTYEKEWWPRTSMVFFVGLILCAQGMWDPWCFILKSLPGTFDLLKGTVFRRERKLNQNRSERNLLKSNKKLGGQIGNTICTMRRMPTKKHGGHSSTFPWDSSLPDQKDLVHWRIPGSLGRLTYRLIFTVLVSVGKYRVTWMRYKGFRYFEIPNIRGWSISWSNT